MNDGTAILESLEPLFERAYKEHLWFYSFYQSMWFSPNELKEMHDAGRFVWGSVNWELRPPQEKLKSLEVDIKASIAGTKHFMTRMEKENDTNNSQSDNLNTTTTKFNK